MVAIQYTDRDATVRVATGGELMRAALAAMEAPSVLDSRPWHWRIDGERLALYADRSAWLPEDPNGRLVTVSCGAALHHAAVALAGDGIGAGIDRLPDAADPDLMAIVRHNGPVERSPRAKRLHRAISLWHSDRRETTDAPIDPAAAKALHAVTERGGARLHVLEPPARRMAITTGADRPRDWLRAGEALSAVLLNAVADGLRVSTVQFPDDDEVARIARSLPAGAGRPAAVIGVATPARLGTPRGPGS